MIKRYTNDQAKRDLDHLLDDVEQGSDVRINRPDGREYMVRPVEPVDRPPIDYEEQWKDLPVIGIELTTDEIVELVREGRERRYEWLDNMTFDEPGQQPEKPKP